MTRAEITDLTGRMPMSSLAMGLSAFEERRVKIGDFATFLIVASLVGR
jgi:hypothetical protein